MARAKRRSKKFFISVDFNGAYPDAKQKSLVAGFCDEALEEFKLLVSSAKVAIVLSADLDDVTLLDEKRHLNSQTSFENCWLGGVIGGVAFDALGRVGNFKFNGVRKIDRNRISLDKENFDDLTFFDEVFGFPHEIFVDPDGIVSGRIHEMVGSWLRIRKFKLLPVSLDNVDLFTGSETDCFGFSGLERSNGGRNEGVSFSGGAVLEPENDPALSFVLDTLPAFEVCCDDCHDEQWSRGEQAAGQEAT